MAEFGLTLITVRVVPFKPEASNLPAVTSFVPQLTINATGQDRTSYEVEVHNIAASAVVSLSPGAPPLILPFVDEPIMRVPHPPRFSEGGRRGCA